MKNELLKIEAPELQLLEQSKAEQIKKTFEPMAEMLSEFEQSFNEIIKESADGITEEITKKAKRLRLDIGKVRIETGKLKDKQKEYIKLEDKAIMGVHNILVWSVKEKEDKLKEIENYFETLEKERLRVLQIERVEAIQQYLEDAHERDLASMDADVWAAYFESKKKAYFDLIEAEKKAEAERIAKEKAEKEEQERIKKENEALRLEAEKQAKIQAEKDAKAEAERKKLEAKIQAEKEAAAKIQADEKAKREKLEAEIQAKKDAELKAKKEEEAKIQAELNKGDAAKKEDLINDLINLKIKYEFKSEANKKMYNQTKELIDKIVNFIK